MPNPGEALHVTVWSKLRELELPSYPEKPTHRIRVAPDVLGDLTGHPSADDPKWYGYPVFRDASLPAGKIEVEPL